MKQSAQRGFDGHRRRKLFSTRFIRVERRKGRILSCIALWTVLFYQVVTRFVFATVEVVGPSMTPSLYHGERQFVHRWTYSVVPPDRGDMVVLRDRHNEDLMVKRIIAKPGETVLLKDGEVFIDGHPLEEPYLPPTTRTYAPPHHVLPVTVPADHYFVMGDNRLWSEDSRHYGPVHRSLLEGYIGR